MKMTKEIRISDFRLAEYFIKKFCQFNNVYISNLKVEFTEGNGFFDSQRNAIVVNLTNSLSKTIYQIVHFYVHYAEHIHKEDLKIEISKESKLNFLSFIFSILKDAAIEKSEEESNDVSISYYPELWLIFKNIICPYFGVGNNDVRIKMVSLQVINLYFYRIYQLSFLNEQN
jgi:hypothetical protein